MSNTATVGFIGLGLMGSRMATRLIEAGYTVHLWNRTAAKADPLIEKSGIAEPSPAAVADAAEIICLCLADTQTVETIVFGDNGVISGALPHKVLVDFSSIAPQATRDMAKRLRDQTGMAWVDAPVSGGIKRAADGQLAIMAGGQDTDIAFVKEHLTPLYARFTRVGPTGAGQTAKLCNQMIVAACLTTIAEVTRLAGEAGIDAERLPEAFAGGWADSTPLQIYLPRMAKREMEPKTGSAGTLIKDACTALELAKSLRVATPMTEAAAAILQRCVDAGLGDEDITALIKLYDR